MMYINKKDLINGINNCEYLGKDKIKSDEKGDNMNIKESEKEEYCISGFYSIVVEAESKEEAIKEVMTMQLNQMDIADVDSVNDMDYRQ